jgi:predicted AlkP superfamily phosphohydrolase/phosphomutase
LGDVIHGELPGPINSLLKESVESRLKFRVTSKNGAASGAAVLHIAGQSFVLEPGQYSDWIRLPFRLAPGVKAHGLCRFLLKQFSPRFEMSSTPIHIDPDRPVMPISHPRVYSNYLARNQGPFATMGLAEDTWSLSENVIDEDAFLRQAYDIDVERQKMFSDALKRTRRGAVVCVFDGPDRIQHMFWRFQDPSHPNYQAGNEAADRHRGVIRDMYRRMDQLVGRTMEAAGSDSAVFVMSDHGFKPFRRGVDLNAWLLANGYLHLRNGATTSDQSYLGEVDWSKTKAYAIGLAGIYVNLQGRESEGIVAPGEERRQLVDELCRRLTGLRDPANNEEAICEAVSRESAYHGPYVDGAVDVIVGYRPGYRVSWESTIGKCAEHVFSDNMNAWSGDHCIHPDLVPGVLFSSIPLNGSKPRITDIGPTTLALLGVPKPTYMDGESLLCGDANSQN